MLIQVASAQPSENVSAAGPAPEAQSSKEAVVADREESPFRFSVDVSGGYDDNPNTDTDDDKEGSSFAGVSGEFSGLFGTDRTSLRLGLSGGYTYFPDREGDDSDLRGRLSVDYSHRFTTRLALTYSGFVAYEPEPDFSTGLTNTRRGGDYFFTSNNFSLAYGWTPKVSTVTKYTLTIVTYPDFEGDDSDDRFEHTFGQEVRYLLLPSTTLVAEYRYGMVEYTDSGSEDRNSTSNYVLAGVDQKLSARSSINFRGGAEFRDYDGQGDKSSPYAELNLDYALAKNTTLTWANRYAIEESFAGQGLTNVAYRTGFRINHAFTQKFSANANIYYVLNNYDNVESSIEVEDQNGDPVETTVSGFDETSIDATVGVTYAFTPNLSAFLNYSFTDVSSDDELREYSRNRGSVGMRATF
jgi:hypothetical protein